MCPALEYPHGPSHRTPILVYLCHTKNVTQNACDADNTAGGRSSPCREGHFEVLDMEPERVPDASAPASDIPAEAQQLHNNAGVAPPVSEIEDARARLERQWA